jgi:hypothetical protein
VNASELLGRGIAQGIAISYYPSTDRTVGTVTEKYAYALIRDGYTNVFREFWPDLSEHVLHHKTTATNYDVRTGAQIEGN